MASLIVNRSAQVALRTLNDVQARADVVRDRISSGLKVARPAQNPAFFLVAAETRSDVAVAKGLRENLVSVDSALTVSFSGLRSLRDNLDNIRSAIVAGENAGYDNGLDEVIRGQIESIRETIRVTSSADQNFLSADGDQTLITSTTRKPDGTLKVNTLTVRSLELDKREASLSEGIEVIPALQTFDLSAGGSVVRFGGRYKVTSLTTSNVARNNTAFNNYRNGPAAADPAPLTNHAAGTQKQWILSQYSDDFRTRNGSDNSVFGGEGNDRLNSGTNNSVLVGGAGDDYVQGTRNGDRAFGGDGDDYVRVTRTGNIASGGAGDDDLRGGGNAEVFFGGAGNDDIRTGNGADIIIGGAGDDDIRAGGGSDLIYEGFGSGSDLIRLQGGGGTVFYEGSASRYTINVINGNRFTVTDNVSGEVDDIRNGNPSVLVFDTAPPDDPDTPVPADFLTSLTIDYSALTDPTNGPALRQSLSFMALVEFLDADTSGFNVAGALQVLDTALQKLNFGEAQLGAYQKTIRRTIEGSQAITDRLEQGVADLVETDFEQESARLAAVQVQESLAIQSLSIANQRQGNVLSLFQ